MEQNTQLSVTINVMETVWRFMQLCLLGYFIETYYGNIIIYIGGERGSMLALYYITEFVNQNITWVTVCCRGTCLPREIRGPGR